MSRKKRKYPQGGAFIVKPGTTCMHDLEINTPNIQDFPPLEILNIHYVARKSPQIHIQVRNK